MKWLHPRGVVDRLIMVGMSCLAARWDVCEHYMFQTMRPWAITSERKIVAIVFEVVCHGWSRLPSFMTSQLAAFVCVVLFQQPEL